MKNEIKIGSVFKCKNHVAWPVYNDYFLTKLVGRFQDNDIFIILEYNKENKRIKILLNDVICYMLYW